MTRGPLSTSSVVDESVRSVLRTAAPWLGVLWLTSLPFRLMQVYMVREALALGHESRRYGDYLFGIAIVTLFGFLVALLGRLIYVRAVHLSIEQGRSPGPEALRVPASAVASCLYVSFLIEVMFVPIVGSIMAAPVIKWIGTPLVVAPLLLAAGLAVVTAHLVKRPGLLAPLRELAASAASKKTLIGLLFFFTCAVAIAWINLFYCSRVVLWMAQGLLSDPLTAWEYLLRPSGGGGLVPAEPLTGFMLYVGTCMAIEPFWLAALGVYVYRLKMRETGDDLRRWFLRLRGGAK
jgi:hypothetical protein